MSLSDIFAGFMRGQGQPPGSPAVAAVTPAQGDSAQGNSAVPNNNTAQSDGTGVAAIPAAGKGEASPLENYKDLFKIDDSKKGVLPGLAPTFTIDNAKIAASAKSIDFTKAIDPTALANASKGDATALATVINAAAQAGFAQATTTAATIMQQAMQQQEKTFRETVMPDILRRNEISTTLRSGNPLADNPAAAPIIKMVEAQLTQQYPNASAAEITKHAQDYFTEFASTVVKQNGGSVISATDLKQSMAQQSQEVDWEKLLSTP